MTLDYSMLPEHMQEGAKLYVERGIEPGGFMRCVLENSLVDAAAKADSINRKHLFEWATWLYSNCPSEAWRTAAKVDAWIEQGGMVGRGSLAPEGTDA